MERKHHLLVFGVWWTDPCFSLDDCVYFTATDGGAVSQGL